jgi:hypothetical protein
LLKKHIDVIPQSLPLLPPAEVEESIPSASPAPSPPCPDATPSLGSRIRDAFRTNRNIFGLVRKYHSKKPPSHDPEEHINLQDLSDQPVAAVDVNSQTLNQDTFYPYPNESSFRLGYWYWNHGYQKSRESFTQLLNIVGNSNFRPEDVRHTEWSSIDVKLAKNDFDVDADEGEERDWFDEDAGWHRTPVNISVPFHSRSKIPGPQNYTIGDLYHRSLVSVIREKLANPHDDQHFHYEPFTLLWTPSDLTEEVQVHGEIYTSAAFLDAHREVQDLPGEPECDLPRVVVAMMFASDATQLTSFGTAKLWPCYLYFGNESKYKRCKPTCHLCNHVAYFQTVSFVSLFFSYYI